MLVKLKGLLAKVADQSWKVRTGVKKDSATNLALAFSCDGQYNLSFKEQGEHEDSVASTEV